MTGPIVTLELDLDRIFGPEHWADSPLVFDGAGPGSDFVSLYQQSRSYGPVTVYIVNGEQDTVTVVLLPRGTRVEFSGEREYPDR